LLKGPLLQDDKTRRQLKSFFRSDAERQYGVEWLTADIFWQRRGRAKMLQTGIEVISIDEVVSGVPRWDWPRTNPFLAGLIAFVVTQAVNELSMIVQNDNGCTLDYAHFYN
jgi:hypothetical protein